MLRMLPWSALREEHFESAQSSEEERLYFRATSRPATFGEVDAFISHSWSDRGPLRFRALQSWAREFEEHNGREPHIWFDKACVDQDDIQRSLLGLPIFVSGCSSFVVLAGPTCARACARVRGVRGVRGQGAGKRLRVWGWAPPWGYP